MILYLPSVGTYSVGLLFTVIDGATFTSSLDPVFSAFSATVAGAARARSITGGWVSSSWVGSWGWVASSGWVASWG